MFSGKDKKEIHKYQILLTKHKYYCLGIWSSIHDIKIQMNTRKENSYIEGQKNLMKDTESKAIINTLETLKAHYKNKYDTVADEFEKSSNVDTMARLHKEMDRFDYYCEAIQQSIDAIKTFIETIEKFLSIEDYRGNENN